MYMPSITARFPTSPKIMFLEEFRGMWD
jgi:hypothetical protein